MASLPFQAAFRQSRVREHRWAADLLRIQFTRMVSPPAVGSQDLSRRQSFIKLEEIQLL